MRKSSPSPPAPRTISRAGGECCPAFQSSSKLRTEGATAGAVEFRGARGTKKLAGSLAFTKFHATQDKFPRFDCQRKVFAPSDGRSEAKGTMLLADHVLEEDNCIPSFSNSCTSNSWL